MFNKIQLWLSSFKNKAILTSVFGIIFLLFGYQNCEKAKLSYKKKTKEVKSSDVKPKIIPVADYQKCGNYKHKETWFKIQSDILEVKSLCSDGSETIDEISQHLEYECQDGKEVALSRIRKGAIVKKGACPNEKANCSSHKHSETWFVLSDDPSARKTSEQKCKKDDSELYKNIYTVYNEYKCDDGIEVLTNISKFGELVDHETCSSEARSCGSRPHGTIWYKQDQVFEENKRTCQDKVTIAANYYQINQQYICNDGNEIENGEMTISKYPYRKVLCPEERNITTECGDHQNTDVWFEKHPVEFIELDYLCENGEIAKRRYEKYQEYKCQNLKIIETSNEKIGAIIRYGSCADLKCNGYFEGQKWLKPTNVTKTKNLACHNSSFVETKRYKVDAIFECHKGIAQATGETQLGHLIEGVGQKCPSKDCSGGIKHLGYIWENTKTENIKIQCSNTPGDNSSHFVKRKYSIKKICKNAKFEATSETRYVDSTNVFCPKVDLTALSTKYFQGTSHNFGYKISKSAKIKKNSWRIDSGKLNSITPQIENGRISVSALSKGQHTLKFFTEDIQGNLGNGEYKFDVLFCNPSTTKSCYPLANGVGRQTCGRSGSSYSRCSLSGCKTDYYKVSHKCISAGVGYYSVYGSYVRKKCTTAPSNSQYTSSGSGRNSCRWVCNSGYSKSGNKCNSLTRVIGQYYDAKVKDHMFSSNISYENKVGRYNYRTPSRSADRIFKFDIKGSFASEPLYRCHLNGLKDIDHMVSHDSNCENINGKTKYKREALLGYVSRNKNSIYSRPIRRCYNSSKPDHMLTYGTCPSGYRSEAIMGYGRR